MTEERCYKVYMHTSLIDDKKYIGITKLKLKDRWRKGNGYFGQYFWQGIEKDGWDNFKHELIFQNLTLIEAQRIEIEMIKFYKTRDENFGYNKSKGGNIPSERTPEVINKIKQNMTTKKSVICLETKEIFESIHEAGEKFNISYKNISRVCNKNRKSINGLHFMFLSEYKEDEQYDLRSGYDFNKKRIICLNNKIIYNSINEASIKLNISASAISSVCLHHRKTTNKLRFMFLDEYDKDKDYDLTIPKNLGVKIVCIDTGEIFNSIADAGRHFNIPKKMTTHITAVCKGKMYSTNGLRFCYLKDYSKDLIDKKLIRKNCKKVICKNSGEIFDSIKDCAEKLKLNQSKIGAVCNKKRKTTGGLSFEFYIDKK